MSDEARVWADEVRIGDQILWCDLPGVVTKVEVDHRRGKRSGRWLHVSIDDDDDDDDHRLYYFDDELIPLFGPRLSWVAGDD